MTVNQLTPLYIPDNCTISVIYLPMCGCGAMHMIGAHSKVPTLASTLV